MIKVVDGAIVIEDVGGNQRVVLQDRLSGAIVLLFDAAGQPAGALSFSPHDGELVVSLADSNGMLRTGIKIHDGEPMICTFDPDGNPLAAHRLENPPVRAGELAVSPN